MLLKHHSLRSFFSALSLYTLPPRHATTRRPFTQNAQLLVLSNHDLRPQLPFLHFPQSRRQTRNQFQTQLSRLLTTETRTFIKDSAKTLGWTTVTFWTVIGLFTISKFGLDNEILERKHPSPSDWSFISKWRYRNAKGLENPDKNETKLVDWAQVGSMYKPLISRLEDPKIDGAGIHPQLGEGEEIFVEGIGKTGLDITQKSEPWRRAYHDALMGAARVAEHLETWVLDRTRGYVFPPEVVVGPSNPNPRPVPFGAQPAPQEEDCEPASELPHFYYMKVLTTYGFTSRQRLDAALAYADWLRYKGLNESAEDMYTWALDIAVTGMPPETDPVDKKTGILKNETTGISSNILLATTSLAAHHAQVGNLAAALPILLSILRAQQSLPPPSIHEQQSAIEDSTEADDSILGIVQSLLSSPEYPPAPLSGDEPATRTHAMICAEGGTMVNLGEILYASSTKSTSSRTAFVDPTPSQAAGLSWTRDGVDLAEATLRAISTKPAKHTVVIGALGHEARPLKKTGKDELEAKKRCAECLVAGISNWTIMARRHQQLEELAGTEKSKSSRAGEQPERKGWFWGNDSRDTPLIRTTPTQENRRWETEARRVAERSLDIKQLLTEEGLDK